MGGLGVEEWPSAGSDDRSSMIIKGKRTKRPRTPSPCGGGSRAVSSSSASGGGGGGDYDLSPSSSSGTMFGSTEEEDMAYCLILLAQGPRRRRDDEADAGMAEGGEFSRSSKKFSEVVTGGVDAVTKAGFYVYECKTCNRTFPSFQALGGHRASHKKPKAAAAAAEDSKKALSELNSDEDEEEGRYREITISPPLRSIPNFPSRLLQASKPKIHECSICGSEFSSGQALGGHMRRHRTAAAPAPMAGHVAMSMDSVITNRHHSSGVSTSRGAVLSLDLNLPAPDDEPKFQYVAAPVAQKTLLLSASALVDCHY